mgnify:FL=1
MTNKLKYTCLIGSFVLAVSIIAGYKVFANYHNTTTETSSLCYKDKSNLDSSINYLFEGKSKRIVCAIIGGNHKDYDNEIKKYCSGYGIKTSFLYGDDGNVIAATLKR